MTEIAAPGRGPLSGPSGRLVAAHRGEVGEVLRRHGILNPEVFGSAARGDDHEGSDVDILVDFPPGTSIIDIIGIQHELEDLLGVPVDLVPRDGLKERVRTRAAKDLIPLRAALTPTSSMTSPPPSRRSIPISSTDRSRSSS
ncbi:nucleotidyltransferase family protein [Ornithinimicrobium faecis]|uniref:Nucleotidyltransferase family protein n=1 Tax=Ornithinimicrobium faecis TaxID=2934158 RepID=A0ABY4YQN9_9MICO|nr:nucleotidyltransferase family protein [Ornithinimicrobium sp. HY1793]USQ79091.1 nucleotidyltransferase family protein [Ornithinimicrobium sp. HY1793]